VGHGPDADEVVHRSQSNSHEQTLSPALGDHPPLSIGTHGIFVASQREHRAGAQAHGVAEYGEGHLSDHPERGGSPAPMSVSEVD
jgi:hypothetical protein